MPAYGYEFYLLVVNSISHSFEDKIHVHARACNILYLCNKHVRARNISKCKCCFTTFLN